MPAVENSLGPCRKPKSTISGWTRVNFSINYGANIIKVKFDFRVAQRRRGAFSASLDFGI
jgi:hypothetical protein